MNMMNGPIHEQTLKTFEQFLNSNHKPNRHETIMEQHKIRVWDKVEKKFYTSKTIHNNTGDVTELLLNQNGEIYICEKRGDIIKLTHEKNFEVENRFIKNLYVGIRDTSEKRYYFNDIVKFTTKGKGGNPPTFSYGVLIWDGDKLAIGSGPINDYTAIDGISERELRDAEIVGNIYQDAKIIMGDLPGHI